MATEWDALWLDVHLATLDQPSGYGELRGGAIAAAGGRIAWIGLERDLPAGAARRCSAVYSCGGRWLTPGLVECHTHLVFAGNRADEFERRLSGESYETISREGGGIQSTVRQTRKASEDELFESAMERVRRLARDGVTTVEVKSGYGLDESSEIRSLRVARRLGDLGPIQVRTTFLGLHALPAASVTDREGYVDHVIHRTLPRVVREGLADQVDAFAESIAFTSAECERFLSAGLTLGLGARVHADQLSDGGGAALAARVGALSADHLEHASRAGIRAMGEAGTVAVLLPGAFLSVGGGVAPPVQGLKALGVAIAVSTDLNPGTSPVCSLTAAMHLSCTLFGLTPADALRGATIHAARALGLRDRGILALGQRADFAIWSVEHPRELSYWLGDDRAREIVIGGCPVALD